ncbi:Hpc2-related domain-containing protein [[Candida] zeylanoides]
MSSRNFTISSMLDDKDAQGAASAAPAEVVGSRSRSPTPGVRAQFQVQAPSSSQSTSQRSILGEDVVIVDDDGSGPGLGPPRRRPLKQATLSPAPALKQATLSPAPPLRATLSPAPPAIKPVSSLPVLVPKYSQSATPSAFEAKPAVVSDQIRSFQTNFKLAPNRASINSIINVDETPIGAGPAAPVAPAAAAAAAAPAADAPKKKRAPRRKKEEPDAKKRKVDEKRKKTPESDATGAATPPAAPTPTVTTERNVSPPTVEPPAPSVVEVEPKAEPPIICLDIPLLDPRDPKPGQSQVVINVLRLTEEKYGWDMMHPDAKSAIDLMDDMIDDDAAEEEEDDAERERERERERELAEKKKPEEEELTEEQLVRQHEVKMNRKVGKYDYEDPFIDDEELQWEEEITSTKEGFFVYWGPLVDDRSSTKKAKAKR